MSSNVNGVAAGDAQVHEVVESKKASSLGKVKNITGKVSESLEKMPPNEKRYLFTAIGCAAIGLSVLNILNFIFGMSTALPVVLPFTATLIGLGALFFYLYRSARDERLYNSPPSVSDLQRRLNLEEWEKKKANLEKLRHQYESNPNDEDLKSTYEREKNEFASLDTLKVQQQTWDKKRDALYSAMTKYRNDQKDDGLKEVYERAKADFLEEIAEEQRKEYEREIDDYFLFHRQTRISDITGLFKNLF